MNRREIIASTIILLALALLIYLTISSFKITPLAILSSNLEVTIPQEYQTVTPGSQIWFSTKVLNLADMGKRDVSLKYEVLDQNRIPVTSKTETVAVQTQASFVASLQLPTTMSDGIYSLKVTLTDSTTQQTIESENSFNVLAEKKEDYTQYLYYVPATIVILLVLSLIFFKGRSTLEKASLRLKIRRIVKKKLSQ